jgi:NADH:ubiquinone oxidoreductase subunit 3 (subunit A)
MSPLLLPPLALLVYIGLVCVLLGGARILGGPRRVERSAEIVYASGEKPARTHATPGYQPFFAAALFFALLHVGVLAASIGAFEPVAVIYLGGVLILLLVVARS